jgi:hypothetical protein
VIRNVRIPTVLDGQGMMATKATLCVSREDPCALTRTDIALTAVCGNRYPPA